MIRYDVLWHDLVRDLNEALAMAVNALESVNDEQGKEEQNEH